MAGDHKGKRPYYTRACATMLYDHWGRVVAKWLVVTLVTTVMGVVFISTHIW